MSDDSPSHSPSDVAGTWPSVDEFVRNILDDRPPEAEVSPSGELYRAIERFHQNINRLRRNINAGAEPGTIMSSDSNPEPQRRVTRDFRDDDPPEPLPAIRGHQPPHSTSLPPLRYLSSRRSPAMSSSGSAQPGRPSRLRASERYSDRRRPSHENHPVSTSLGDLDDLEDANSHLRALLDFTTNNPIIPPLMPPAISPAMSPPLHTSDHNDDSRRVKRRKLDSDRLGSGYKGIRYGRYGQVEPGALVMEIESCDGGMFASETSYAAENILKNDDDAVYCTKGNRCNIVLRHQGSAIFELKELVIKAPGQKYSSPVREGMVFVSMHRDDLLTRTAQYQIQYLPQRSSSRRLHERGFRPLAPILSIRHGEDGSISTRMRERQRRLYSIGMDDEDEDEYRTAQLPVEFLGDSPPFNVTMECSDDGADGMHTGLARRAPNRIGSLPFETVDSEDAIPWGTSDDYDDALGYSYPSRRRSLTLAEAAEASQYATQEAVRAVGGELMAPHARFYIEKDKTKCTIRFDPPVSGRYILLKMWNPRQDPTGNIDIKEVIAKGFAGPRYFPAVEMR